VQSLRGKEKGDSSTAIENDQFISNIMQSGFNNNRTLHLGSEALPKLEIPGSELRVLDREEGEDLTRLKEDLESEWRIRNGTMDRHRCLHVDHDSPIATNKDHAIHK